MPDFVFNPGAWPTLPVMDSDAMFPVRRVYCVGRNYADHIREMGHDPDREAPFFFQKPADSIVAEGGRIPYPPITDDFHHEVEYVLAIGKQGVNIDVNDADDYVYGIALGIDLTRRDRQLDARKAGRPWEIGKSFDHSAPCSAIKALNGTAIPEQGKITLAVNDEIKQQGDLAQMIWGASEVVAQLSLGYTLMPGDLIFTGTPAGVGPLVRGDRVSASLENLGTLEIEIV